MKSEIFDGRRFAATLLRDLRMDCRSLVTTAVGSAAALAFVVYFIEVDGYSDESGVNSTLMSMRHGTLLDMFCAFFWLVSVFLGTYFGYGNATPGQRLANLTVPSSTLEKCLSRWIVSVPLVMAGACVCWEAVDVLRMLVESAVCHHAVAPPAWFWQGFARIGDGWAVLFACQATMILGSAIWHKRAALKTLFAVWSVNAVYGAVFLTINVLTPAGWAKGGRTAVWINLFQHDFEVVLWGFCIAWTLFCYGMTYLRTTEQEIIDHM